MIEYRYEVLPTGLAGINTKKANLFLNEVAADGWRVVQIAVDGGFHYVLLARGE